jgi:hypothetical protein
MGPYLMKLKSEPETSSTTGATKATGKGGGTYLGHNAKPDWMPEGHSMIFIGRAPSKKPGKPKKDP